MALFVDLVALSNGLHGSVQMDSVAPPPWNTQSCLKGNKGKEKDIMKRLFSILLAEVLYLVAIVCRWCIVITHFIAYLYTGFFVFMLFLHFTGIARVLDHYTSTEYIISVGAIIVFFLSRSILEYLCVKASNAHYRLLNY